MNLDISLLATGEKGQDWNNKKSMKKNIVGAEAGAGSVTK